MRLQLTGPALMEKKGSLSETTLTQTPQKCDKENGLCNFESSKISSLNQGTIIRKSSWAEKFPRLIVTSLRILFNISKIVWFLDENVTATFLKWRPVFLPEWPDLFKRLKKKVDKATFSSKNLSIFQIWKKKSLNSVTIEVLGNLLSPTWFFVKLSF